MIYIDEIFSWKSKKSYKLNKCRIRIYWVTWERAVVIVTSMTNNYVEKISDITKEIIDFCSVQHNIAPNKIMLIEHYSTTGFPEEDIYLHVILTNDQPMKYEIEKHELKELIKIPI